MIVTGSRSSFLELAKARGYDEQECLRCVCWQSVEIVAVDTEHPSYPKQNRIGLGDMVAAGLAVFGITEERVSAVVGGDCGCSKRKAALNELGKTIGIG